MLSSAPRMCLLIGHISMPLNLTAVALDHYLIITKPMKLKIWARKTADVYYWYGE